MARLNVVKGRDDFLRLKMLGGEERLGGGGGCRVLVPEILLGWEGGISWGKVYIFNARDIRGKQRVGERRQERGEEGWDRWGRRAETW